ncbi:MAG: hypothetical protein QMD10_09930 [Desulfitobacteriaceae bacterium]|nr:hypothetical protein [Desulfitobacteriaceae bacterium]
MSIEEKTTVVLQRHAQPFRVQLTRGQRGAYGWKIDVQGEDRAAVIYEIDLIDEYLRGRYLNEQSRLGTLQKPCSEPADDPHQRIEQSIQNVKKAGEKGVFGGEMPWEK